VEDELSLRECRDEFRDEAVSCATAGGGISTHETLQDLHVFPCHGLVPKLIAVYVVFG
jgi:hypothetical protein